MLNGCHKVFTAGIYLSLSCYLCCRGKFGKLDTQLFAEPFPVCFIIVRDLSNFHMCSFQVKFYLNREMICVYSPLIGLRITRDQYAF